MGSKVHRQTTGLLKMKAVAQEVFGQSGPAFLQISKDVLARAKSPTFDWPTDTYAHIVKTDPVGANNIFWVEILGRIYLCAVLSIARQRCWMNGALGAYEQGNFLSFCASLRSLIESSADSYYSLVDVGYVLAENFKEINLKFSDPSYLLIPGKDLNQFEDRLIHFIHADKKGRNSDGPEAHKSKQATFYINHLVDFSPDLVELYRELCGLVHPAAPSLSWALSVVQDNSMNAWRYEIEYSDAQQKHISELVSANREGLLKLPLAGANPGLVALKLMSMLDTPPFDLRFMNMVNLSNIPVWKKHMKMVKSKGENSALGRNKAN